MKDVGANYRGKGKWMTQTGESVTRHAALANKGEPLKNAVFDIMRWRRYGACNVFGSIKLVPYVTGGAMARYSSIGNFSSNATTSVSKSRAGI
jgi:hypothetical protein